MSIDLKKKVAELEAKKLYLAELISNNEAELTYFHTALDLEENNR